MIFMIRSWDFNGKDFGCCIDCLRLATQSLFRISGHREVFTAIIVVIIIIIMIMIMIMIMIIITIIIIIIITESLQS